MKRGSVSRLALASPSLNETVDSQVHSVYETIHSFTPYRDRNS